MIGELDEELDGLIIWQFYGFMGIYIYNIYIIYDIYIYIYILIW